jgi:hypothetical protein
MILVVSRRIAGGQVCTEMNSSNQPPAPAPGPPARVLPDNAVCRARESGFGDYVDCLVSEPHQCAHALSFGRAFLCRHPQAKAIAARTNAQVNPR